MDDQTLEGGLQFVRNVYLCRELAGGVERFCSLPTKILIENELAFRTQSGGLLPNFGNPFATSKRVPDDLAHVTALVLKELDAPEHSFLESPTPVGMEALGNLKGYIYGEDKKLSLGHLACHGTYSQACLTAQLCIAILIEAVSSTNCFSLLLASEETNCLKLKETATRCIFSQFTEAVTSNFESFAMLTEAQLLSILTSSQLVLDSEIEVFNALSWWTEAALPERFHRFGYLMASCLRFEELSLEELTQILDESELVANDSCAMQLGARAVIQRHMGVSLDIMPGNSKFLQPRIRRTRRAPDNDDESPCTSQSRDASMEHAPNTTIGHDHGRGQDLPSSEGCEGPSITEEMMLSPRSSYNEKSCVAQLCETFKRFAGRASIRRSLSYTLD